MVTKRSRMYGLFLCSGSFAGISAIAQTSSCARPSCAPWQYAFLASAAFAWQCKGWNSSDPYGHLAFRTRGFLGAYRRHRAIRGSFVYASVMLRIGRESGVTPGGTRSASQPCGFPQNVSAHIFSNEPLEATLDRNIERSTGSLTFAH